MTAIVRITNPLGNDEDIVVTERSSGGQPGSGDPGPVSVDTVSTYMIRPSPYEQTLTIYDDRRLLITARKRDA